MELKQYTLKIVYTHQGDKGMVKSKLYTIQALSLESAIQLVRDKFKEDMKDINVYNSYVMQVCNLKK